MITNNMNDIQFLINRQLGIYHRFNYDNILKRLVVNNEECFYGLQNTLAADVIEQEPPIFACRFSDAPGYEHVLALANEDGRVAIQDTLKKSTASSLLGFQCHNNAVFDLAWMPGHTKFVTVSGDNTASLWDVSVSSLENVCVFSSHTKSVKTAVFKPSEPSVFATGGRDGNILIWDIRANNTPCMILKPDNKLMNCHSFLPRKALSSQRKRPRFDKRTISVTGLVFQDDMTLLSCGECDGIIKVWDLRKNYNNYTKVPLPKHHIPYCGNSTKNGYTNLIIDHTRTRLYASCMDNVIYCFNISTYKTLPEQIYVGHENSTFYIKASLSPDCRYLVSGSSDKNAYIWNLKYSEPILKLVGHWAEVTCAAWCQTDDMKIVTCSDDARHKIWRIGREFPDREEEFKGKAEVIPRTDHVKWETTLNKTPSSMKRKSTAPFYSAKIVKVEESSKECIMRCIIELLLNASKNGKEYLGKSLKTESDDRKLLQAGTKRNSSLIETCPAKKKCSGTDRASSNNWEYLAPIAGTSFMTPSKKYEKTNTKILSVSPKSSKNTTSPTKSPYGTPVKVSPTKVRILSLNSPTKDLPNYVLPGETPPRLTAMWPLGKKQDNWLTLMARAKKEKEIANKSPTSICLSPKENLSSLRGSSMKKTPVSSKKSETLLKYFKVVSKKES